LIGISISAQLYFAKRILLQKIALRADIEKDSTSCKLDWDLYLTAGVFQRSCILIQKIVLRADIKKIALRVNGIFISPQVYFSAAASYYKR
jgi:hypothetical protein